MRREDATRVLVRRAERCAAPVHVIRIEDGGHPQPGGHQFLPQSNIGGVSRQVTSTVVVVFLEEVGGR